MMSGEKNFFGKEKDLLLKPVKYAEKNLQFINIERTLQEYVQKNVEINSRK